MALKVHLTALEHKRAHDAVYGGGDDTEQLARGHNVNFTRRDIRFLRDGAWLSDETVNMVAAIVKQWAAARGGPKIYLPNSFFFAKLMGDNRNEYTYTNVRDWTKRATVSL